MSDALQYLKKFFSTPFNMLVLLLLAIFIVVVSLVLANRGNQVDTVIDTATPIPVSYQYSADELAFLGDIPDDDEGAPPYEPMPIDVALQLMQYVSNIDSLSEIGYSEEEISVVEQILLEKMAQIYQGKLDYYYLIMTSPQFFREWRGSADVVKIFVSSPYIFEFDEPPYLAIISKKDGDINVELMQLN